MEHSEDRASLYTAMAKAQGEFSAVLKNKEGYGYKYATLHGILEMARPILNKYGLAIIQDWTIEDEQVHLITQVMHGSGKCISFSCKAPLIQLKGCNSLQSAGASITYVRRYHLEAILGIAGEEDTDAHGEEKTRQEKKEAPDELLSLRKQIGRIMTSGVFTEEQIDSVRNEVRKIKSVVTLRAILETWREKQEAIEVKTYENYKDRGAS